MSVLFERTEINNMVLANRFVRSATWLGMAAGDGAVTPRLIHTMKTLAEGRVGLIISGHAYVSPEGLAGPWQLGAYKDELVPGLKGMTEAVHDAGGRIVMQIAHAGTFAFAKETGLEPWAVSVFEGLARSPRHEMTLEDIQALAAAFGDAARRAREAGFDGVQIHAAHGYLLSQFLSPAFNRRRDEYGGSVENRSRAHLEVYRAVREAVGADYPVLIKMNGRDFGEGGLEVKDALEAALRLEAAGLDAVELSGGLVTGGRLSPSRPGIKTEDREAYFREEALIFKEKLRIPLILVGGIRSFGVAEGLVQGGVADYISMSRPLIREPYLVRRWMEGERQRSICLSDNLCFGPGRKGKGVFCVTDKKEAFASGV
jgi:2,4-dienoyl-CoA reductase-like NADH-dependent reductase (Old Yellow Enzyme family)